MTRAGAQPTAPTVADPAPGPVLAIEGLSLSVPGDAGPVPLLADVFLSVHPGETVGLVGESGSGKSLTIRSALGMLPRRASVSGRVEVGGTDVLRVSADGLRRLRNSTAAMIFQDPRASINPVRRIGDYLTEGLRATGMSRSQARAEGLDLLERVGLRDPARAFRQHPHEFSGGMLQRVVIAGALSTRPRLLLADEPTTALDVTTQAEVIALLKDLQAERGMGLVFVTHDLGLAAAVCDRVYVMYAGRIVEHAPSEHLFRSPAHPYTAALLAAHPSLHGPRNELRAIPGRPLALAEAPSGCSFRDRCPQAVGACGDDVPLERRHGGADVACIRPGKENWS
ncbi:ABC transporter ATP-binding protein [Blastococcus sp. BMG 814]|uniref:ABC transporter ATP-binding protein n=1 Tax=Blastococcus carthaginiensis TaxID=3050034 RepID=A0ABT9IEV0_9ACTN|nr:ABC transporter ATP-binding protein [Blastococcus carthaginiensis]MDP5183625.1 ABC transporter ATP-binding protein [Blastococcus carthaginiensis]